MSKESERRREMGYFNLPRFIALCERSTVCVDEATGRMDMADIDTISNHYDFLHKEYRGRTNSPYNALYINEVLSNVYSLGNKGGNIPGSTISQFNAVEMAAWTHKAVDDRRMKVKDNEERSVMHAIFIIKDLGLPESFADEVAGIILSTKQNKISSNNSLLFCEATSRAKKTLGIL